MDEFTLEEFVAKAKDKLDDMLANPEEANPGDEETYNAETWLNVLEEMIHNG
jgi:hypothetical protein